MKGRYCGLRCPCDCICDCIICIIPCIICIMARIVVSSEAVSLVWGISAVAPLARDIIGHSCMVCMRAGCLCSDCAR